MTHSRRKKIKARHRQARGAPQWKTSQERTRECKISWQIRPLNPDTAKPTIVAMI
jgi:hypothetical protein